MDLEQKSIERIKMASEMSLHHYGKPLICTYSGGKDSDVMLELFKRSGVPFEVSHGLTTVDAPPTVRHIKETFTRLEEAGITATIHRSKMTMWQLIPHKKMPPCRMQRYCCEEYMGSVRHLVLATGKRLDLIDTLDIDWYLAQYEQHKGVRTEKITNRTYNNERRNLSAFFTWMRKSKIVQDNPVDNVDAKKVVMGKIDYYSREEIIELRDACKSKRDRAIIEVFRSTGARVGEIADIRLDQVNMHTGDIPIIGEKGGRARTLYLDAEARYYLAAYLDERKDNSPYLFTQTVGAKRGRMGTATYRTIMRKIGKRAKIQCRVYPHKMRKTLGMDLKQHGLDIGIIQEILGHASPAVTSMYYAQSTTESLRSVRQRLSA